MFRVYLDNIEIKGVTGFDDFTESIERDEDVRGLFISYPLELTFTYDGYDYIINKLNLNGFCQTIEVLIQEKCGADYEDSINGLLFLSDIKRNKTECSLKVRITDNSWGAKIKNNKNIKSKLDVPLSKNGVTITPCPWTEVLMFDPASGSSTTSKYGYDVIDAFEYLVLFMTDGAMDFISDYLSSLTINGYAAIMHLFLFTGQELREGTRVGVPDISFQQLFDNINKKFNIGFTIEDNGGRPRIRIENIDYFYKADINFVADKIPLLESVFDPELLYASIAIGSTTADYNPTIHSLPPIRFLGFKEEQYTVQGTCNIDKELDLVNDFIIDSNIIEELVFSNTSNKGYDEDVFIIQAHFQSGGYRATQGFYISNSADLPALYNEIMTNKHVAPRWAVQGNIAKYLGSGDDEFLAERTTVGSNVTHTFLTSTTVSPFPFNDDSTAPNFDTNNNYNNTLYKYTSNQDGVYGFEVDIVLEVSSVSDFNSLIRIVSERYTAANVLIESNILLNTASLYGTHTYHGEFSYYLNSGEYVSIKTLVTSGGITYRYINGSTFACVASITGGGIYEPKDPDAYYVEKLEFEYPISKQDFDIIKADPSKAWTIGMQPANTRSAWISKVTRKSKGGLAKCEMITNNDNL